MITRRTALASLAGAASALVPGFAQPRARRPNFIVLLADDYGYGDVGCYGSKDIRTPHIDSIARNGARFTDGYVTAALCSPSRAGLLSGRYQQRFGHEFNPGGALDREPNIGLPTDQTLLPKRLKAAGYATGMIGKWHLGATPAYHPCDRGFDEYFGFLIGANAYYNPKSPGGKHGSPTPGAAAELLDDPARQFQMLHNKQPIEEPEYLTDAFGREAVSFIERHSREPFFLYLAFNAVHVPLHATDRYYDRAANIPDERRRLLAAMAMAMDDAIGNVLQALKRTGIEKDTGVFFLSDNGSPIHQRAGTNGPLNGQKATYYEGGIRIPFCMQWPGTVPAGQTFREPVISLDLPATFCAAAGIPKAAELDGVDLAPHLLGKNKSAPHDYLFWRAGRIGVVRKGDWKLLQLDESGIRLHNLASDLGEKKNVAANNPKVVEDLQAAWKGWNAKNVDPLWRGAPLMIPVNGDRIRWDG
jgi:arylsulfatase A-like enzyme